VVLKETALGFIITYGELMRTANQLAEFRLLRNPLQLYAVVGIIFILVNYALSKLAVYVERRVARGRKTAAPPPPQAAVEAAVIGGTTLIASTGPDEPPS
jgi:glutamate transport system permease protein